MAIHARIVLPRIHLCSLKDALEPTSTLLELVDQFVSAEPRQQLLQQSLGHGCILLPRVELLDHLEQLLLVLLQKECDHFGDAFGLLLAVIGGLEGLVSGQDCVKVLLIEQDGLYRVLGTLENGWRNLTWHAREEGLRRRRSSRDKSIHSVEEVP